MSKPLIIAVHGSGQHTKAGFAEQISTPLDKASKAFASLGASFSNHFDIEVVEYNSIFDRIRTQLAEDASTLSAKFPKFNQVPGLIQKITDLGGSFSQDNFFYTHLLDVLLYKSLYGQEVQVRVAKQILQLMTEHVGRPIYFMAHSLGTAVLHDTLHKLYSNQFSQSEQAEISQQLPYRSLNANEFPIAAVIMLANVSRLIGAGQNPYQSKVKPGTDGICQRFINCRHVLDPFTMIKRFEPSAGWDNSPFVAFRQVVIQGVGQVNVHEIEHYLQDPKVFQAIFKVLYNGRFNPTPTESAAVAAAHQTVQGNFSRLVTSLKEAEVGISFNPAGDDVIAIDREDIDDIIMQINTLVALLKSLQAQAHTLGAQ